MHHPKKASSNPWATTLPAIPDAECAIVAALLRNPDLINDIELSPEDFYDPTAKELFRAATGLHRRQDPVDSVSLAIELKETGSRFGSCEISKILGYPPSGSAETLAKKIKEYALRRRLMSLSIKLHEAASDPSSAVMDAVSLFGKAVDDILCGRPGRATQELREIASEMLKNAFKNDRKRAILTPFPILDRITGGLHSAELVTLAGRPGTGKTALALNLASSAAFGGSRIGIFSLEMAQEALAQRICAACMGIDAQLFRTGKFTQTDIQQMKRFEQTTQRMSMKIFESPRVDPDLIRAECRAWKRREGLDLVIIDYLQLINASSSRKESTREREVAETTRSIKQLAVELGIPIILLAQLSRSVESRDDKTPRLSDLRESGCIEQDSDQVWFLTPWNIAQNELDIVNVRLIVAKSRNSSVGTVPLEYVRRHLRFQEVAA